MSVKAVAARRLGAELDRAMRARGVGRTRLSRMCSISHTLVAQYRLGTTLPHLEVATSLAGALDWPPLADIVRDARAGRCALDMCGRPFINNGGGVKRFCSARCREIARPARDAEGVSSPCGAALGISGSAQLDRRAS